MLIVDSGFDFRYYSSSMEKKLSINICYFCLSLSHGNLNYVNNFRLQWKWSSLQNSTFPVISTRSSKWYRLKYTLMYVTPFWHAMFAISRFYFQLFMQGTLIVLWQYGSTCSRDKQLLNSQLDATLFTPKLKRNPIHLGLVDGEIRLPVQNLLLKQHREYWNALFHSRRKSKCVLQTVPVHISTALVNLCHTWFNIIQDLRVPYNFRGTIKKWH